MLPDMFEGSDTRLCSGTAQLQQLVTSVNDVVAILVLQVLFGDASGFLRSLEAWKRNQPAVV